MNRNSQWLSVKKTFSEFLLVTNKSFDITWSLVKKLAEIMHNVPSTFEHCWSYSRKDCRGRQITGTEFLLLKSRNLKWPSSPIKTAKSAFDTLIRSLLAPGFCSHFESDARQLSTNLAKKISRFQGDFSQLAYRFNQTQIKYLRNFNEYKSSHLKLRWGFWSLCSPQK